MSETPHLVPEAMRKLLEAGLAQDAPRPHAVRDGRLITGQQHFSGTLTAQVVIATLGR
jgi:hypothetical protein